MVIRIDKEQELAKVEDIREARSKATDSLIRYLETYRAEQTSESKHALMGPVGKLLSKITTTGDINWEAVKGFVLSVHKNLQSPRGVSADAAIRLDESVDALSELKALLPPTKWLMTVEDIDDEVFFGLYKKRLIGQRKGIQKKFHAWLKDNITLDEINEPLPDEMQYESFKDVEDPFSVPEQLAVIRNRFWEDYRKPKRGGKK